MSAGEPTNQHLAGLLYRDHRDWLLGWLRKSLYSAERAEDLSQDSFIRLLGRADLQQAREPRALLTTIARGLSECQTTASWRLQGLCFGPSSGRQKVSWQSSPRPAWAQTLRHQRLARAA